VQVLVANIERIDGVAASSRPRGLPFYLFYLLTVIVAAGLFTEIYLSRQNTLLHNGRWRSSKTSLARGVMGAAAFMVTPTALSRNRLNLAAWHGFQEVKYRDPLNLREVSFDFQLRNESYLTFVHHGDANGFAGIRISRNPAFPPIAFTATPDGGIVTRESIPVPALDDDWNRLRVAFAEREYSVYLHGARLFTRPLPASAPRLQVFGFRGGYNTAFVDNVEIARADAPEVIREDFSNSRGAGKVFVVMLVLVLACNALMARNKRADRLLPVNIAISSSLLAFLGLNYLFLSSLHPLFIWDWGGFQNTIEEQDAIVARIRRDHSQRPPRGYRVLFVGTSQTWGAGASRVEDISSARVERALNAQTVEGSPVECVNVGISGVESPVLAGLYQNEWVGSLRPNLVVVDLGNNDNDEARYRQSRESVASINATRGIETLFVLEANSIESDMVKLFRMHQVMREVAARHHIPVLNLHEYMAQRHDAGMLWWDYVHLTSSGQQLMAERLVQGVREVMNAKPIKAGRLL